MSRALALFPRMVCLAALSALGLSLAACAPAPSVSGAPPAAAPLRPPAPYNPTAPLRARADASDPDAVQVREMAMDAPVAAPFRPLAELPFTPPSYGKAIVVNIPTYELIAFEDGRPVLRSKVIVGKRSTPTPVMDVETSVVRFRPYWRPTPSMLASGHYEDGIRPPGRRNPLGLAAVRFDNGSLVYLHGTNSPHLFDRERRALSGGCIRVEKLEQVVAFVLDWPVDQVREAMQGRRTFDADTSGVPVMLRYYLDMPDAQGRPQVARDIYRRGRNMVAGDI